MCRLTVAWLLGFVALAPAAQGRVETVRTASDAERLVIIGASYAGSWKAPALPGFEVINKGVAGEETHQVRARFERDALALKPASVLIWGHINNIHRAPGGDYASAIERAKADYVDMISRARNAGVRVVLATEVTLSEAVGWIDRAVAFVGRLRGKQGYNARINEQVRILNDWLRTYARQQGIELLDFEKVFDDGAGFRKREYTTEDGSHISKEGYTALTAYARSHLRAR
jgi:lysophospholipase L1-like esterase